MFENIHNKVSIPNQQKDQKGTIVTKKVGRPKAPNMEKVQIKMDKVFHSQVKAYAKRLGVTKSSLISIALKNFLKEEEKRYKLVQV